MIPHGILADRFPSLTIGGATVAEVIEGWGRQVGMGEIPLDKRPVVDVAGFETDESLLEAPPAELHLMPAMFGGGGVAKIVVGSVLIAAGILLPPGPWSAPLIAAGLSSVIGGAMELMMKAPKVDKDKDPDASRYLGSGKNSTAIGTPIGIGGGRMKIGGQYLSLQVNSNDMVYGTFPSSPPA